MFRIGSIASLLVATAWLGVGMEASSFSLVFALVFAPIHSLTRASIECNKGESLPPRPCRFFLMMR